MVLHDGAQRLLRKRGPLVLCNMQTFTGAIMVAYECLRRSPSPLNASLHYSGFAWGTHDSCPSCQTASHAAPPEGGVDGAAWLPQIVKRCVILAWRLASRGGVEAVAFDVRGTGCA